MKVFFSKILGLNDSTGLSGMEHTDWVLWYNLTTVYLREMHIAEQMWFI